MPRRITPGDLMGIPTFDSAYLDPNYRIEDGTGCDGGSAGDPSGYVTPAAPSFSC
jgi:hypothetical protein